MKILNLYAGIGGNRKLWGDEHDITAVEIDPDIAAVYQQLYPSDTVIVADAHQYLLEHFKEYDFIWSSPPCPTHSRLRTAIKKRVYPDMTLYQEIIFLQKWYYGKWVVENVIPYYAPLIEPSVTLARHHFWSNFTIANTVTDFIKVDVSRNGIGKLSEAYSIELPASTKNQRKLLRNCVIPEVGLHILTEATK